MKADYLLNNAFPFMPDDQCVDDCRVLSHFSGIPPQYSLQSPWPDASSLSAFPLVNIESNLRRK